MKCMDCDRTTENHPKDFAGGWTDSETKQVVCDWCLGKMFVRAIEAGIEKPITMTVTIK